MSEWHNSESLDRDARRRFSSRPNHGLLMWPSLLLGTYCLLILGASCAGGWLPTRMRLSHTRMQTVMSFVAGLMLGVSLLHMIPHSAAQFESLDHAVLAALIGLLAMFFLIRTFHFHHHDAGETTDDSCGGAHGHSHGHAHGHAHPHEHSHACSHSHEPGHDHSHEKGDEHRSAPNAKSGPAADAGKNSDGGGDVDDDAEPDALKSLGHRFGWLGLFFGLALHTLIDGMALGASVAAEASHGHGGSLLGLGTFLAVFLHKPLDALSIASLMLASGWSASRRGFVTFIFALMCPAGAAAFWFGFGDLGGQHHAWLGAALAFSAGVFLCISLGDLLPEVHFHSHDRLKLSLSLIAGVTLAYLVGFLEPHGAHGHGAPQPGAAAHDHDHDHDHGQSHDDAHGHAPGAHDGHDHASETKKKQ